MEVVQVARIMTEKSTIRARFAPSPTGYLHVGGARSALFNWLFCRKHGGTFVLRIEDTDIQRNIAGADQKLRDDLQWLGIDLDESPDKSGEYGPYRQSERLHLYKAAQEKLLASGNAYYAFDTPEELDALRKQAEAEKRGFKYPRPTKFPTTEEAERAKAEGRPVVVRFKTPDEPITVHDELLGDVTLETGQLDDFVIAKSNGWPTYHLAVVVDDAQMQITHVLRAQEHLMNTPKHVFLQRALGYETPKYVHLPLVFNIDGTKMSKRDKHKTVRKVVKERLKANTWSKDAVSQVAACSEEALKKWLDKSDTELDMDQVERIAMAVGVEIPEIDVHDFRSSGYLSEALVNFIALIGWSPGDDREQMTIDEMVAAFSIDRINKTSGRFDREKLLAMNTDWCAAASPQRLLEAFKDWAQVSGSPMATLDDTVTTRVLDACKGFRTFRDVEGKAGILFAPDERVEYDPKAVKKVLEKKDGQGYVMLERLLPALESVDAWTAEGLDAMIKNFCEENDAKLGDVAQPIRVAVAGRPVSPAIGETLALLGVEKTVNRIRRCLSKRK
ncbi:MAG: glutamate--tRNA ligase [Phycisphaerales bacterium]|nr:glutamate--tRNA ligase [Phycisphaerales bacterium]